jgi:hypothetical protein
VLPFRKTLRAPVTVLGRGDWLHQPNHELLSQK